MNKEMEKRPAAPASGKDGPERKETKAIQASIEVILHTRVSGRSFQPALGCRLYDPVNAWLDVTDRERACEEAAGIIGEYEPRAANVRVVVESAQENGKPDFLKVSWVVKSTGQYDELVVPFPLNS